MSHPIYVCPHDGAALSVGPTALHCPGCGQTFPMEDGIALLDVIQNQDRGAFDPSARSSVRLTAEQLSAAPRKAEALLGSQGWAYGAGFAEVNFQSYAGPAFYNNWLRHLFSVYGIENRGLTK